MNVYYFKGNIICTQLNELINIFNYRTNNNSNYIEVNEGFPFITVLIKDCYACVIFYQDEFDCGHYAYIQEPWLNENESTMFFMGTDKIQTETLISNKFVIPISTAWEIVEEFFTNNKRLNTINWFDL